MSWNETIADTTELNHVWYFADVNKFKIVDHNLHWYWDFMCIKPRHIIYLGEL